MRYAASVSAQSSTANSMSRCAIEIGKLQESVKLPSVRQLAQLLGVSRNTTQIAYEQLLAEGYIRSEAKKGYYVQISVANDLLQNKPTGIPESKREIIELSF